MDPHRFSNIQHATINNSYLQHGQSRVEAPASTFTTPSTTAVSDCTVGLYLRFRLLRNILHTFISNMNITNLVLIKALAYIHETIYQVFYTV